MTLESSDSDFTVSGVLGSILIIGITFLFFGGFYPFEFTHFWFGGDLGEMLGKTWWVFPWGVGLSILASLLPDPVVRKGQGPRPFGRDITAGEVAIVGTIVSVLAGVLEEIVYRWFFFFSAMAGVAFGNWLLGGLFGAFIVIGFAALFGFWLGAVLGDDDAFHGILGGVLLGVFFCILIMSNGLWADPLEWLHVNLTGPIANFFTFGHLEEWIFHPAGWFIGAGMLAANAKFRAGHQYQGPLGVINSWFAGMLLFWVMFHYGLFAAILLHFLYDFVLMAVYLPLVVLAQERW